MHYYQFEIVDNKVLKPQGSNSPLIEKEHKSVYQAIENTPTNLEVIIKKSRKKVAEVMSILTILELDGKIEQLAGNYYQKSKGT